MPETAIQTTTRGQIQKQDAAELFRPSSFTEAMDFAKVLADSGMVPKAYVGKPYAIIATWQFGLELGVGLMQALQGISNINGTPAVFGDLGWALVQNHPDFVDSIEDLTDKSATVTLKRRGRSDKTRTYTLEDARIAKLLEKDNWKAHTRRMLQWRARSWAMRDQFPDALKGMVIAEEAQDYPGPTIEASPLAQAVEAANAQPATTATTNTTAAVEQKPPATIGREKAVEWYKLYKAHGWTAEESKAFLKATIGVENSYDIPVSRYAEAETWAKNKAPVLQQVEVAFGVLDWKPEERVAFLNERNWDCHKALEELKAEIAKRDAQEG